MPYGTLQADTVADSYNASLAPISVPFRNRIINGAMVIDQRNAGAAQINITSPAWICDRFQFLTSQNSKWSLQQLPVTDLAGYNNSAYVTISTTYTTGASDFALVEHKIEGFNSADFAWGTANAKPVTLSFWVKTNVVGTYGVTVLNSATNRAYCTTYSVASSGAWTQATITIPGDTSGTWLTNNGIGIWLRFSLGAGSTYAFPTPNTWGTTIGYQPSGGAVISGNAGGYWQFTGVQLEKGSNATSFDYRPYGTELSLCQRYYWQMGKDIAYSNFGNGFSGSATINYLDLPLKQTMRVVPTLVTTGTASNYQILLGLSAIALSVVPTIDALNSNTDIVLIASTVATGLTAGQGGLLRANNTTSAFLGFNSEL